MILAIDTATAAVGVALASPGGSVVAATELVLAKRHVESLVPTVEFVCAQAGVALSELTLVAVDTGPGLFTGLRVGVAAAKSFAQALGVPVVGVGSLEALAAGLAPWSGRVAALVDARRGEVYGAVFDVWADEADGSGTWARPTLLVEPWVAPPADVAAVLADCDPRPALAVGDALARYGDAFGALPDAGPTHRYPTAASVARLAAGRADRAVEPAALGLAYLRPPDAQIRWETR